VGYSEQSDPTSILCAQVPSQPDLPSTTNTVNNITISWTAPNN